MESKFKLDKIITHSSFAPAGPAFCWRPLTCQRPGLGLARQTQSLLPEAPSPPRPQPEFHLSCSQFSAGLVLLVSDNLNIPTCPLASVPPGPHPRARPAVYIPPAGSRRVELHELESLTATLGPLPGPCNSGQGRLTRQGLILHYVRPWHWHHES